MINMAKKKRKSSKKKGTKRRRSTKKVKRRVVKKKNLAAPVGLAITAAKAETSTVSWGGTLANAQKNAIHSIFEPALAPWRKYAIDETIIKYKKEGAPALVGITLSFGEDIPLIGGLVREVKRPANRLLGKVQKVLTGSKKARFKL